MQTTHRAGAVEHPAATDRHPLIVFAAVVSLSATILALAACTTSGATDQPAPGSASAAESARPSGSGDAAASPDTDATEGALVVGFDELLADPGGYIGQRIEVTGRVFFLSSCPPPGASPMTPCTLQGYLAHPDRGVFIASDAKDAILLAQGGQALSCPEEPGATACGDWASATRYTVIGEVERRILGGRETEQVQLNVESKTADRD